MKAEKTLLLVAVTLILVALLVGITGANPANPANTNTGTVHREGAHTNTRNRPYGRRVLLHWWRVHVHRDVAVQVVWWSTRIRLDRGKES